MANNSNKSFINLLEENYITGFYEFLSTILTFTLMIQ